MATTTGHTWTIQIVRTDAQAGVRLAYLFCPRCGELRVTPVGAGGTMRLDVEGDCPAHDAPKYG